LVRNYKGETLKMNCKWHESSLWYTESDVHKSKFQVSIAVYYKRWNKGLGCHGHMNLNLHVTTVSTVNIEAFLSLIIFMIKLNTGVQSWSETAKEKH
jgi:hypothetical protein